MVEKRVNATTGASGPETRRSPSVIVYTPAGFVGVHFPPLNRKPFAADAPTPEEAQAALRGYIGYYGALTVYPGQVFHNILGVQQQILIAVGSLVRRANRLQCGRAAICLTGQFQRSVWPPLVRRRS